MKSSRMLLVLVIPVLAVAAFLGRSSAQPAAAPAARQVPATRVAVCDIATVFNKYQRVKDLNDLFVKKRKAIADEEEQGKQKIRQIGKMLDALRPGSKEYEAKIVEFEKKSVEQAIAVKIRKNAVLRWHRLLTEEMYREILAAVAVVAKQRNCDLVLYRESVEIASQSTSELLNKIAQRKCLYCNPAIDLTDMVLKRINGKYINRPK